jgi:hypothetical protein
VTQCGTSAIVKKRISGHFRFGPIPLKNADGMLIEMLS